MSDTFKIAKLYPIPKQVVVVFNHTNKMNVIIPLSISIILFVVFIDSSPAYTSNFLSHSDFQCSCSQEYTSMCDSGDENSECIDCQTQCELLKKNSTRSRLMTMEQEQWSEIYRRDPREATSNATDFTSLNETIHGIIEASSKGICDGMSKVPSHFGCGSGLLLGAGIGSVVPILGPVIGGTIGTALGCTAGKIVEKSFCGLIS